MQTIDRQCLTKSWILGKAAELAPVEPVQLERCILAFELLGRIADAEIDDVNALLPGRRRLCTPRRGAARP